SAEVGTSFSFTHFDGSLAPYADLNAVGKSGAIDFNASVYVEKTNGQFDADGDRIHPDPNGQGGMADSEIYNLFLKVGSTFGDQRVELSALYYDHTQDSDYNTRINGSVADGIKTTAAEGALDERAIPTGNSNLLLNGSYSHEDIMGSSMQVLAYYQEYENIFGFSDFYPEDGQSVIQSNKHGLRFDVNTPLNESGANVLWGVDYAVDTTEQFVLNSGLGDRSVRVWAPEVKQTGLAGFAQATVPLGDVVTLRGGVRHEEIDVSFDGFTALFSGVTVQPGEASYSATTFNAGGNFAVADWLDLYASYSEGFSTAEVGRVLRQADETTDFANSEIEASVVKASEIGARFDFGDYRASIAAYRAKSNLGTSITADLQISRAPEKTYGFEVTFDATPTDKLSYGGSLTYTNGKKDTDEDGDFDRFLGSNRTGPVKLTGYVSYDVSEKLSTRLQALYSAKRDPFETIQGFAEAPVEAYTVVDFSASYQISEAGSVTLGVHNLLNADYFSLASQFFNRDDRYSKAPGRTMKLSYTANF
ncbi:MAG: TonB-dependent receptor, partial [Kordiimonas sp.]